ncbi:MAG: hypothetical protein IJK58_03745 [Clostridia bacterium]|nr:hypothetical protein [Clostridia bacterium]
MDKRKKKIVLSAVLISLAVLLAAGLTLAWFINFKSNKVGAYTVQVSSGEILQISLDNESWDNSITLDYPNLDMVDISGDGMTFVRPELVPIEADENYPVSHSEPNEEDQSHWAVPISTADVEGHTGAAAQDYTDAQYISFTVYFKANVAMDVYVGGGTKLVPDDMQNTSAYGNFSKDCIAGAARVAALNNVGEELFFWVPNSTYQLSYINAEGGGWTMNTAGTPEASYSYYKFDDVEDKYVLNTFAAGDYITSIPNLTFDARPDETDPVQAAMKLATLTRAEGETEYTGSATFNIWVEGTDREARRALAGGKFNTDIVFIAYIVN